MRRTDLQYILESHLHQKIQSVSAMSGGDINQVFNVAGTENNFVVKVNRASMYPSMFLKEAQGLKLLQTAVQTPDVVDVFDEEEHQFLVLEYIEEEMISNQFWINFGRSLAQLHQVGNASFGLDHNNFIGSIIQINDTDYSWIDFFIEKRIEPLVQMALDSGLIQRERILSFEKLYQVLPDLLPENQVSLIHGDLWSGNLMCGKDQQAVFIDPAVYYGHREVDIAMTKLFGGFDMRYLDVYQDILPLDQGWSSRVEIYNLYPRLVHLNLFGSSYLSGINAVLKRFV